MDGRRLLQLSVLGLNLLLGSLVVASAADRWLDRYQPDDMFLFLLALLGATVSSLHRQCRTLPSLASLFALTLVNLLVMGILVPNLIRCRHRCGGHLTACKSNVKNIATGLEMYSTDNQGRYPASLAQLTPNYLKTIPVCPSAQKDTYSLHYSVAVSPEAYTVACGGCYHHAAGLDTPNYPQYSSSFGLIMP